MPEGTYNLECMRHDPYGHQLLPIVSPVHHQGVCQALDDGALGFAEALHGVAAGRVGDVDGLADLDVVSAGRVLVSWVGNGSWEGIESSR